MKKKIKKSESNAVKSRGEACERVGSAEIVEEVSAGGVEGVSGLGLGVNKYYIYGYNYRTY